MREKLIEILRKPIFPHELVDPIEAVADYLLDNGVTIHKWIPVSERLPDHFGTFLVAIDEVHGENRVSVDAADFDLSEKRWSTFGYFCAGFKITHWMPLPEPPKGE